MRIGIDGRLIGIKEGVGRYISEITRRIASMDRENEYILYVKPPAIETIRKAFGGGGGGEGRVRLEAVRGAIFMAREQAELPALMLRHRLDLFHATVDHGMPLITPCPAVLTVHDAFFGPEVYFRSEWTRRYYQFMTRLGVRKAKRVITVSNFIREKLISFIPDSAGKIRVVHNGVGGEFSHEGGYTPPEFLKGLGITEYILYVGALTAHKNIKGLLEGYASLLKKRASAPPLLVCGAVKANVSDPVLYASSLGIGDKVHFMGTVPDGELGALYRGASLFVFPSIHEGFGIPVLEAMASGTPVVTSRRAAMPEVAGDAAILVDPLNPDEIGGAIEKVLFTPALMEGLRSKGIKNASRFSWDKTALGVLDVYREVHGKA